MVQVSCSPHCLICALVAIMLRQVNRIRKSVTCSWLTVGRMNYVPSFISKSISKATSFRCGVENFEMKGRLMVTFRPMLNRVPVVGGVQARHLAAISFAVRAMGLPAGLGLNCFVFCCHGASDSEECNRIQQSLRDSYACISDSVNCDKHMDTHNRRDESWQTCLCA